MVGKPCCGYKVHEALGTDSRLITAVEAVPGNAQGAVQTATLLAQNTPPCPEGGVVIDDSYYHNATTVVQVQATGARPSFAGQTAERVSDPFTYGAAGDQMVCRPPRAWVVRS